MRRLKHRPSESEAQCVKQQRRLTEPINKQKNSPLKKGRDIRGTTLVNKRKTLFVRSVPDNGYLTGPPLQHRFFAAGPSVTQEVKYSLFLPLRCFQSAAPFPW